jgi:hypothetical protein
VRGAREAAVVAVWHAGYPVAGYPHGTRNEEGSWRDVAEAV